MLTNQISNRIKELRLSRSMTQEMLAEKANIDESYLGKIERGIKSNLTIETLDKIIKALDISYDEFFSFGDLEGSTKELIHEISLIKDKDKLMELLLDFVKLKVK